MNEIFSHRFWADCLIRCDEELSEKIAELTIIGATNLRYDSLDDFMFLGNIPSNKRRQLRKYLKNIGCTSIRIEEPNDFWYEHDDCSNRQLRPRIIILVLSLALFMIILAIIAGIAKIL
ncbi:MAG: hypothetical protein KAI67_01905 [Candidatus Pacebacteria bacterium]|nr:hypothetical protein [Candidatus Paceibacterota bacterium]